MKTKLIIALCAAIVSNAISADLAVGNLSVSNALTIANSVSLSVNEGGALQCVDAYNAVLFYIDPADPSFQVPGLMVVGGYFQAAGPVAFNSTVITHLSRPTNSVYSASFDDAVVALPAGETRSVSLNAGYDGRQIVIKDTGTASGTNVVVSDVHGYKIDGATSISLSNDFQSVTLIYDGEALTWWKIK